MFSLPSFRSQDARPAARCPQARRPLVEDLEGRKLLTGLVADATGAHFSTVAVAEVQSAPTGTNLMTPDCGIIKCGGHLGG